MNRLTLLVLVDAFRHDYVQRTAFLRRLARESRTGALREDFGFVPRAAYFGGLSPADAGFTNMYCYDPAASPFGVARGLPHSRRGRDVEDVFGLREWIEAEARKRVTPFAASYLSSAEIPIDLLADFDLVEKRAPWDPRAGYRSIFHELDERGWPYFTCAWPDTNRLDDRSDRGIVAETLARVRPPCRFAFVHLQELDAIGHAFGPESREVRTAIEAADYHVETLVAELARRYDALDLLVFGDHGMVSVTGSIDVWAALDAAALRPGRDVVFFLDSTMARFWFPVAGARDRVIDALAELPGRVLDEGDLKRLRLAGCDGRNAELVFLAPPGVLISPNFFQRRGDLVRGMHGYDPDCPDNQGIFLVRDHGHQTAEEIGTVGPTTIYSEIRRQLHLPEAQTPAPSRAHVFVGANGHWRLSGTLTQVPDAGAHALLQRHMRRIVEETRRLVPGLDAILLTGSFGRDEGGLIRNGAGELTPLNDYDVLVVSQYGPEPQSDEWHTLGVRLAREFGIDFVHYCVWRQWDPALPLTIANYDVRYGSHVLWGREDVLHALPQFAAADIPLFEGVQLLFNRLAGLLTVGPPANGSGGDARHGVYLTNQVVKGLLAIGDWHLLSVRGYDVSYQTRGERFAWLAPGFRIEPGKADAIRRAYRYKIRPDEGDGQRLASLASAARTWLVTASIEAVAQTTGRTARSPVDAAAVYFKTTAGDEATVRADNEFATRTLADDHVVRVNGTPSRSVRQTIYAALPLVAAAADGDSDAFHAASSQLSSVLTGDWPCELTPETWEHTRSRLAHAWLRLVH